MDLLGLIKEKLSDAVIDKISGFLGEHPDKIGTALNSAVPTVLGGIMQKATNLEETGKVMDILKDGGHTGDILDDLSGLLGHFDKTQMLITIGTNIANHFFGDKTNNVIETLSSVSGIRKTSSSSLMGLATPLVLGAIGKVVEKEGLGVSGLMKLLGEQKEGIQKALPPALYNLLDIKNTTPATPSETTVQENIVPKSDFSKWIPWILLVLLGLGALAWVKGFKNYFKSKKSADTLVVNTIPPKASINDSSFVALGKADSVAMATKNSNISAKPNEKEITKPATETKEAPSTKETSPKTETVTNSGGALSDKLDSNADTWVGLNDVSFKKKSAEIVKTSALNDLIKYLKNHAKTKIKIGGFKDGDKRLSEDRAYAVREVLIENGIGEGRIQVSSDPIESNEAKVAVKILKK